MIINLLKLCNFNLLLKSNTVKCAKNSFLTFVKMYKDPEMK